MITKIGHMHVNKKQDVRMMDNEKEGGSCRKREPKKLTISMNVVFHKKSHLLEDLGTYGAMILKLNSHIPQNPKQNFAHANS
jgi:hypothetical protein